MKVGIIFFNHNNQLHNYKTEIKVGMDFIQTLFVDHNNQLHIYDLIHIFKRNLLYLYCILDLYLYSYLSLYPYLQSSSTLFILQAPIEKPINGVNCICICICICISVFGTVFGTEFLSISVFVCVFAVLINIVHPAGSHRKAH